VANAILPTHSRVSVREQNVFVASISGVRRCKKKIGEFQESEFLTNKYLTRLQFCSANFSLKIAKNTFLGSQNNKLDTSALGPFPSFCCA